MVESEKANEYWFDAGPLVEAAPPVPDELRPARSNFRKAWSGSKSVKDRVAALVNADVKGMATDWWTYGGPPRKLERFGQANGLLYKRQAYDMHRPDSMPGLIFTGECEDILGYQGPPAVEFGNHRSVGSEVARAFGYVAVRHDLALPHLVLDSLANDSERPNAWAGIYARKDNYSSLNENYRGSDSGTPLGRFARRETIVLDGETDKHFRTYCEPGQEAYVRAFLTGDTLRLMTHVTASFDVEVTGSWIFLYGYSFDVSTDEPERWAWILSLTSRVMDLIAALGEAAGQRPQWERPPFYTADWVQRPASLAHLPKPSPGSHAARDSDSGIFGWLDW
ncbi:hypothetical protein BIU82_13995 [Arthrobacter sp. SW1]|uniref:hypothetical protein n=1 Tax=Arthrobacter sp. SW1 TaxID=1920889 RepID=UPI000877E844|nr:hypothetical protein [Arthrobacter sp. SW1]OFI39438.1 hypothetical protein BIU82_13995 [Arthrobacter sp. SW1]